MKRRLYKFILRVLYPMWGNAIVDMLLKNFPKGYASEFMELFVGEKAGVITTTKSCGCIAEVVHDPKRHVWSLTIDYSNCKNQQRFKK